MARKVTDDKVAQCVWVPIRKIGRRNKGCKVYGTTSIEERHRHRYEVDIATVNSWKSRLKFSGMSPDGRLPKL